MSSGDYGLKCKIGHVRTEDLEGLRKQLYGRIDALAKLIQNDIKTYENTKVNTTEEFKDLKGAIQLLEKYRHDVDIAENLDQLHLVEHNMNWEEQYEQVAVKRLDYLLHH
ncbi:unnamed protein product [Oppiella nova]|uniref:Uncharacterized protein n=1 Tax=Oppiella nova TaxID=334625 RepID=A0A7R9M614_9ACAR|nr:unnamed protein product [Oppiella nova]CAG2171418.1 unnamed protein product [Oppiella nova]